jgi:hypothetical protein
MCNDEQIPSGAAAALATEPGRAAGRVLWIERHGALLTVYGLVSARVREVADVRATDAIPPQRS